MGCWEEYCLVCGGPAILPILEDWLEYPEDRSDEEKEALRAALTGLEWLDRYVGVLGTEELISLGPYNSRGGFDNLHDITLETPISAANFHYDDVLSMDWDPEDSKYLALTCHEKCYKLLQTKLGYTLRFQDVWPMLMEQIEISNVSSPWGTSRASSLACNSFRWTSYDGIGVYQEQGFNFAQAVTDGNAWMLQDPTINERNASRVVEVWQPLVENGFKIPTQSSTGNLESKSVDLGLWVPKKDPNVKFVDFGPRVPRNDPNAPRPIRPAYDFFVGEQRPRLKVLHPDKDWEIFLMICEAWNGLSEEEHLHYHELGVTDRERYRIETREYREKLKTGYYDNPANGQERAQDVAVSPREPCSARPVCQPLKTYQNN